MKVKKLMAYLKECPDDLDVVIEGENEVQVGFSILDGLYPKQCVIFKLRNKDIVKAE